MSSHGAHLGIRDKIKIYALPKAICNRPLYFARKIGSGLSAFYIHFHKWLTFNGCGTTAKLSRDPTRIISICVVGAKIKLCLNIVRCRDPEFNPRDGPKNVCLEEKTSLQKL